MTNPEVQTKAEHDWRDALLDDIDSYALNIRDRSKDHLTVDWIRLELLRLSDKIKAKRAEHG